MAIKPQTITEQLKEKLSHIESEVRVARSLILEMEKNLESDKIMEILEKAEKISQGRRDWTREMIAAQGDRLMEECRADAIARGIAIEDEKEVAIGD